MFAPDSRGRTRVHQPPELLKGVLHCFYHDGRAVYARGDGNLYAIDVDTGEQEWTIKIGPSEETETSLTKPGVVNGTVFAGRGNFIHGVDADTGKDEWVFTVEEGKKIFTLGVARGTVLALSLDGEMYALDTELSDSSSSATEDDGDGSSLLQRIIEAITGG